MAPHHPLSRPGETPRTEGISKVTASNKDRLSFQTWVQFHYDFFRAGRPVENMTLAIIYTHVKHKGTVYVVMETKSWLMVPSSPITRGYASQTGNKRSTASTPKLPRHEPPPPTPGAPLKKSFPIELTLKFISLLTHFIHRPGQLSAPTFFLAGIAARL